MSASTITRTRDHAAWVAPHADLLQSASRAIGAVIGEAGWAVWRWYQLRRTCRQVSGLSDYLLQDIGLSRTHVLPAAIRRVREEELRRRFAFY